MMGWLKHYPQLFLCVFIFLRHDVLASPRSKVTAAFVSSASKKLTNLGGRSLKQGRHAQIQQSVVVLGATDGNGNEISSSGSSSTSKSARERGIYARPSAAIEKGSGFFIPGLEGSRIRFLFGITVLLADAANHVLVGGRPGDWGQVVAESVSAFYGALLLLQGSIELAVEKGFAIGGSGTDVISSDNDGGTATNTKQDGGIGQRIADSLQGNESAVKLIQRMAQTIINFTPATDFRFVSEDLGVLYSFGVDNQVMGIDTDEQKRLINLALDAVSGSRGGRVALPSDHPASKLLPPEATRCILVQKVDGFMGSRACMIIGSDKLLPSFTKNDLRWIGQLASYNNLMG